MPHKIKACDGGIGNIIEGSGTLNDQELIEFYTPHLTGDPLKFKRYRYGLVDYSAVTQVDVSNQAVQVIADLCIKAAQINPDPVVAYVANSDLVFGLTRMFEAFVYELQWDVMVFRNKKDALAWIRNKVKDKFDIDNLTFS